MAKLNINDLPIGVIITSQDFIIIDVNNYILKALNYSAGELIASSFQSICFNQNDYQELLETLSSKNKINNYCLKLKIKGSESFYSTISITTTHSEQNKYIITLNNSCNNLEIQSSLNYLATKFPNVSGTNIFNDIARHMGESLNKDYILIGEFINEKTNVIVLGGYAQAGKIEFHKYNLEDSPCLHPKDKQFCTYESGVRQLFPNDKLVKELNIESSACSLFYNKKGEPLGFIAILDSKPLKNKILAETQLLIFKDRIGAEIERLNSEKLPVELKENHHALKQAISETELQAFEEKIEVVLEESQEAIFIIDLKGVFINGNQATEKLLGYQQNKLIGKNLLKKIFLSEKQFHRASILLKKNNLGQSTIPQEFILTKKDGTNANVEISTHPVKIKEKTFVIGIIRDVTQKIQSNRKIIENELKLNSFFNAAPIGIGTVINRVFTYTNHLFCSMLGYTEDELIGKDSGILYPDKKEYDKVGVKKYAEIMQKGFGTTETKFKTKSGKILNIHLSSTPINKNDLSQGVVFTAMDITERKRSELIKEMTNNITNAVINTPNLRELIIKIRKELGRIINTSNFFIALYDKETDTLSTPFFADKNDNFTSWHAKKTLTGYVIEKRKPLFITKNEILELIRENEIELIGTVSELWLGLPLFIENKIIGALVIQDYENAHAFSMDDFEILKFISHQISISIERKRAENKIQELQEYLQFQINRMPIGLIIWDEFLHVKSWNPSAENIFGYTEKEALGKNAYELIIPEDIHSLTNDIWTRLLNGDETAHSINENVKKSGERIICKWTNTPLKKENGTINGVLAMVQEVTEKERTEEALRESEEKYKNLIDQSPEGIYTTDLKGNFLSVNKTMCSTLQLSEQQLLSKNILELIPPDSHHLYQNRFSKLLKGEKYSSPMEYEIITNNSTLLFVEGVSFPFFLKGKLSGIQGIVRNITKRKITEIELNRYQENLETIVHERTSELESQTKKLKESHEALSFLLADVNESRKELEISNREILKLSQAVEQSPTAAMITDTEGNIEYVNKIFCKITGYSNEEALGKNPRFINSKTHSQEFFKNMWETIKTGTVWHGEICNKKKNDDIYWENTSISPLRNVEQEITHFIAIKEDITERKQTEEKLKEYTEELELFNNVMVDRELKIIEMKEEVNKLSQELGRGIIYPPVWETN